MDPTRGGGGGKGEDSIDWHLEVERIVNPLTSGAENDLLKESCTSSKVKCKYHGYRRPSYINSLYKLDTSTEANITLAAIVGCWTALISCLCSSHFLFHSASVPKAHDSSDILYA